MPLPTGQVVEAVLAVPAGAAMDVEAALQGVTAALAMRVRRKDGM